MAKRKDSTMDYFSPQPATPEPPVQQMTFTGSTTPTRDDLNLDGGPSLPPKFPATTPPPQTTKKGQ